MKKIAAFLLALTMLAGITAAFAAAPSAEDVEYVETIGEGDIAIVWTDDPNPGDDAGTNELAFDIDFGDGTTGIAETSTLNSQPSTPFWYTLDGRRLSGEPKRKGIYLNNGRKVVIK